MADIGASGPSWDPLVRLTHWTIALAVVLNGVFVEGDVLAHIWIGYVALGLLALRLLWGLIGTGPARFSSFPPSFSGAFRHVRDLRRGIHPVAPSHNPLGALMAYALWGMLLVVSVTGVMLEGEPFPEHESEYEMPYEDDHDDGEHEGFIEDVHETAADLLLLLALFHVGGVALETRLSGRNLVRAMLSGRRS